MYPAPFAQAVALVSFGNACLSLRRATYPVEWSHHSAFRSVNTIVFQRRVYTAKVIRRWQRVGTAPERWLQDTANERNANMRLAIRRGGETAIRIKSSLGEIVWTGSQSYVGDRFDGRVWDVTYSGRDDVRNDYWPDVDVPTACVALRATIQIAAEVAGEAGLWGWQSRFEEAGAVLDGTSDCFIPYHPELLTPHAPRHAQRLAAAAGSAWLSGGAPPRDLQLTETQLRAYCRFVKLLREPVRVAFVAAANAPPNVTPRARPRVLRSDDAERLKDRD